MDSSKRQALAEFLRVYADGRYRNAVIEFLPESGEYLVLVGSDVMPFSERARAMLERRAASKAGVQIRAEQFAGKINPTTSAALAQLLTPILGDNIVDAAVTMSGPRTTEVVVLVQDVDSASEVGLKARVQAKTSAFMKSYDLSLKRLYFSQIADSLPSVVQVLRVIYTNAPATLKCIMAALADEQRPAPSENWLKRQLDRLIRGGAIAWQEPGRYSPTQSGIAALPAFRNRRSPDVARALALGRRKW